MSGKAPAPQRIVPPLGDQPLIQPNGHPSFPMTQWMQRLSAFVGPVQTSGSGGSSTNLSLSEQVSNLTSIVNSLAAQTSADLAARGRLASLEQQILSLKALLAQQRSQPESFVAPRAPAFVPPAPLPMPPAPQQNLAFVAGPTGITYLANGARVIDGYGVPNGVVYGSVGDEYLQLDGTLGTGVAWVKTSGALTNTGWTAVEAGNIWAPAVSGDLPGPNLISDPAGQVVMVQIV